jgi:signal peptidase I
VKKIVTIIFFLLILIHLILGIWWLAVGWGIGWGLLWLGTSSLKVAVRFRRMTYLVYPLLMIIVVMAAITFKTLFLEFMSSPPAPWRKQLYRVIWCGSTT